MPATILGQERKLKGWKPSPPDPRDIKFATPLHARFTCPSSIDMSRWVTPIESQTDNDCTANTGTTVYESTVKKSGKIPMDMSRRFLYFATRVWVEGQEPTADEGAFIRSVMKAMKHYGIPYESDWSYSLPLEKPPTDAVRKQAEKHQVLNYYSCPSLLSIKYALSKGYFVAGGFMVPTSIGDDDTTQTGVVKLPKKGEGWDGGHAVSFCGYNDSMRAGGMRGFLMFANSWGKGWGKKGFGFLPYEYVKRGWALDFWAMKAVEG